MLRKLWIEGFRNLDAQTVEFGSHSTVIVGENNQGKTNLLEAIWFAVNGTSFVGENKQDLIQFGKSRAKIGIDFEANGIGHRLYRDLDGDRKGMIRLDGCPCGQSKVSSLIRCRHWSADLVRLFQESPDSRRSVFDEFCLAISPGYSNALKKYRRILMQRNAALKAENRALVDLYSGPFIESAFTVAAVRQKNLSIIADRINRFLVPLELLGGQRLSCKMVFKHIDGPDYKMQLANTLGRFSEKEWAIGYTSVGPHRDDFDLFDEEGRSVFRYLSRGVNRVVAICAQLALNSFLDDSDVRTVFVLDDALCEISEALKSSIVLNLLNNRQVIYTSTMETDLTLFSGGKRYQLSNGKIHHG
ncbi:DNA replication and repair protein RecF [bacterium]|nr:DNA replication and repair protein RecF [bacterium]